MTIFWRRVLSLWLSPSAVLCGIVGWAAWQTYPHIIVATDKWGNAAPAATLNKVNATLDKINAGCVDIQGDYVCGPIEQLSQTEKNVGILAARSAQQVQQTGTLVTAVANNLNTVGEAVKSSAGHINVTADAATGTLTAATGTLTAATGAIQTLTIDAKTANDLLVQLKPLIASYTATGNDLDTTIKTANGIMASPNVTIMLANGAQFTTTAVQLEQKLAQCTLHPTLPCVLKSDILFGAQVGGYLLR
jgi:hypothetical protein